MNIAIILPAHNEELTIRETIEDFHKYCPTGTIVVVNNNSQDQTETIAKATLERLKCGFLLRERRQGKGFAVRSGLKAIKADIYVLADADTTYKAKDLEKLLQPILLDDADMVVGDRFALNHYQKENTRMFHNLGNKLVITLINLLFKAKLHDIMSGYRVFSRNFIQSFPLMSVGFELETEMTLHALDSRMRVQEVPITYVNRPAGSFSKLHTFHDGTKVLSLIVMIFKDYRPFLFFSSLSCVFFLLALYAGSPVILEYVQTKYIAHIPLAILATGLVLLAVNSFTAGIILETLVRFHRKEWELTNKYFD